MKFEKLLKMLGPVVVMAIAGGLAACDGARMTINGDEGVPLSELDLSGDPPTEVASFGPDAVDIRTGGTLAIEVEGSSEAKERIGGFSVIDVPDLDAAIALVRTWPSLQLPGVSVEIRPMVEDYSQFE